MVYQRGDDGSAPLRVPGADGLVAGVRYVPSPNCNDYPPGPPPGLLVVHNISLPPCRYGGDAVERLFTNTLDPAADPYFADIHALRVSAHFFIRRDGELVQFVPVGKRAWHAGVSSWRGREGCNDFSLGVELEGCDYEPFTDAQYRTLIALAKGLSQAGPLELAGHSDIAPGRKTDPGPYFDWSRLRRGLAG
ncbi:1,6-anhydro-N-acetylmuramyl-L-alanine amidase AmpD [Paludibacterium yongneupense]|uniref:1,6-anhydro-N-acetylmuramyl-L-alanine amidase AmpD n=1 Tax=Paludibacterium yongneupense TaxID=400061 RepID=UPI003CCE66AD